ncbi:Tetratricopeptide repeat-containing protein [Salegentibacter holothuriorum]|uniref:Tetratricopeptide repeat-containing protein n=1 Tax=Salegentibacter holothuriorum TaxID=241145 RepID=A0A1T5BY52_9FLAO|nr:tetratricopeptide repeat protein [Salegentibacter holothuriorum]SKB52302.1 Tetratricopeptide repeat-containing protein [Salegentibacter holothuriorum]
MKKYVFIIAMLSGALFSFQGSSAQEKEVVLKDVNRDDLGNVTDEFQEQFFEALKQKGIENYEKAILALEECQKLEPNNPVVYFEMARNYNELEDYDRAIANLEKAHQLAPRREDVLNQLYKSYTRAKQYDNAVESLLKLLNFDNDYKEKLANIYLLNRQYEEALQTIDELDKEEGPSTYRNQLRRQIYARTGDTAAQIENLEQGIANNPENEQNYLNLIYIYSDMGEDEQAYNTALQLLEANPGSTLVHLALYKFHLNREEAEEAVSSMKIVFDSEEIDPESKFKVLNDFLNFVDNNPEYEEDLMQVSKMLSERENAPKLYGQLGQYYMKRGELEDALNFFNAGLAENTEDFQLVKNTIFIQLELEKYKEARDLSKEMLEVFPAQPVLFLLQGIARNQLEEPREAIEILTFGLDYLIDNPRMEIDFYMQLKIAHEKLGEEEKSAEYSQKVEALIKEIE